MKKRSLITLALVCLILFCILSVFTEISGKNGEEKTVFIPMGSSAKTISKILKQENIIESPLLFRLYSREYVSLMTAGSHTMYENMAYKDLVLELQKSVPMGEIVKVTIPEGYELREIAKKLEENGICSQKDFYDAAKNGTFHYDFLDSSQKGETRLEGYLFPATYDFTLNMTAENVIDTMLSRFAELPLSEYKERAAELGYSLNDVIIMASIVEREAQAAEDRAKVSSVFYNRLKINMPLQSCATVQYILKERKAVLSVSDTKIDSPYNTYQNYGLPPTPIASPGEACIKAALYPDSTDYLYFYADGSGKHIFSKNYQEHLEAQRNG